MYKIDEQLKEEISKIISLEMKNPHLTGMISVTHVKTTPDLRYAQVFVSMIGEKDRKENLKILKASSGYIRSEIAHRINLRITPEIVFVFDDSMEYGERIDNILKNLSEDREKMQESFKNFGDNNE
jgi:ribosome-binding factor A